MVLPYDRWYGWQGTWSQRLAGGRPVFFNEGAIDPSTLPFPDLPDGNTVYNMALTRLNEKVRGSLDLSIALGEAGKTAAMVNAHNRFGNWLEGVSKFNSNPRRLTKNGQLRNKAGKLIRPPKSIPIPIVGRKWGVVKAVAKTLGNRWLEYQYGWKPLISDIYNAHDEMMKAARKKMNFRASARLPIDSYKLTNATGHVLTVNARVEGWYGVRFSVNCYLPESAFDLQRWTSLNPVSIGWELLPFSFVVDWFIDVGSFVRNFETACLNQTRFHSGYYSRMWHAKIEYAGFKNEPLNTVIMNAKRQTRTFQRTVLYSFPFPATPHFEIKLGWQRLLSAAALLGQFLPNTKKAQKVR